MVLNNKNDNRFYYLYCNCQEEMVFINGFVNLIKNKTCFKGQESSVDLILTNRKYSFENSSLYKIGVSDHHHLMYTIFKLHYQNLKSRA